MIEWLWSPEKFLPESKFWRVAIPTAIGTGLGSWFFWSSLISAGRYVWALIWWQVAIPLWLLSILGFSALAWIGFFAYRYTEERRKEPHEEKFTETMIEGIRWQWSWENGEPIGLTPLCPECGMEMDYGDNYSKNVYSPNKEYRSVISCPSGHKRKEWRMKNISWVFDFTRREIERRVRKNEWG